MAKFAKFRRLRRLNFAKFAMRAAWLRVISHTTPARHYMKEVGAQLVGGVPLDAVSVACSAAARRLREARRLQQQALPS